MTFTSINKVVSQIDYCSFFRMSISLLALFSILVYGNDFFDLFTGEAISLADQHELTNYRENIAFNLINIFNTDDIRSLFSILRLIYIITLIFLFFGFLTRFSAAIAFLLNLMIYYNSPLLIYGYDEFMHLSLLFCFLFKVSSRLSLDNLISPKKSSIFLIYHIRIILAVCYFFSGLSKAVDGAGWWNGQKFLNAIHYRTVIDKDTFFVDFFSQYTLLAIAIGIFTVVLELIYPIMIFMKKYQITLLYMIILFHLGIAIILQLTTFSIIMIVWNITAFYPFINNEKSIFPKNLWHVLNKKLV